MLWFGFCFFLRIFNSQIAIARIHVAMDSSSVYVCVRVCGVATLTKSSTNLLSYSCVNSDVTIKLNCSVGITNVKCDHQPLRSPWVKKKQNEQKIIRLCAAKCEATTNRFDGNKKNKNVYLAIYSHWYMPFCIVSIHCVDLFPDFSQLCCLFRIFSVQIFTLKRIPQPLFCVTDFHRIRIRFLAEKKTLFLAFIWLNSNSDKLNKNHDQI